MNRFLALLLPCVFVVAFSGCDNLFAGGPGAGGTGPVTASSGDANSPALQVRLIPPVKENGVENGESTLDMGASPTSPCNAWSRKLTIVGAEATEGTVLSLSQGKLLTFKAVIKNISTTSQSVQLPICQAFRLKTDAGKAVELSTSSADKSSCGANQQSISYDAKEQREFILNWQPEVGRYVLSFVHDATTQGNALRCAPVRLKFEVF